MKDHSLTDRFGGVAHTEFEFVYTGRCIEGMKAVKDPVVTGTIQDIRGESVSKRIVDAK
jgi:hypothetical protein